MYKDSIFDVATNPNLPYERFIGKNILITGATGLIGTALVDVLMARPESEFQVYAAGRNETRAKERFVEYTHRKNFHFLKYDVLSPLDSNVDFHFIIHAASNASPNDFATHPVEVMKSNLIGVCNLFDYGLKHGLERLLYISSGEIYGQGDGSDFDESHSGYVDTTLPRSCYPSSKRAAETLCVSYADEYGVDVVIARPCHIYGPKFSESDNRAYAQFFRNAIQGEDIVLKSSGEQIRSWCYVIDCASALLHILLKGESGQAYNIAESSCTIRVLAETVAMTKGTGVTFVLPTDYERKGYNIVMRSILSCKRLAHLGWSPRFDLSKGIRESIDELLHIY